MKTLRRLINNGRAIVKLFWTLVVEEITLWGRVLAFLGVMLGLIITQFPKALWSPPEDYGRLETVKILSQYCFYKIVKLEDTLGKRFLIFISFTTSGTVVLLQVALVYFAGEYIGKLIIAVLWAVLFPGLAFFVYRIGRKGLISWNELPKFIARKEIPHAPIKFKFNIIAALLLTMLAVPIYIFGSFYSTTGLYTPDGKLITDFGQCLYFSTTTFVTLGIGDLIPPVSAKGVVALESVLGYLYLGLLIVIVFDVISLGTDESRTTDNKKEVEKDLKRKNPPKRRKG